MASKYTAEFINEELIKQTLAQNAQITQDEFNSIMAKA